MIKECDVLVIGSGPGGYVAAIRCAQLGLKTIIAEKYPSLGGTCLNVGCIPSKALLDSSELYLQAAHRFKEHGIQVTGLQPDFTQMMKRKNGVIAQTVEGIRFLMKKNKIEVLEGIASFTSPSEVIIVEGKDKGVQIKASNYIIATGSKPSKLKGVPVDEKRVLTSTGALSLSEIPKSMVIIGGGVIGLELGSVYSRLGTAVGVVEYMDALIPSMDRSLGKELMKVMEKEGVKFYLNHTVKEVKASAKKVKLSATANASGEPLELEADYCLLSTGRSAYTEGLGLEHAGIRTDERGKIPVDAHLHTGVGSIYAIGDVVKGAMLAHKAEDEGIFVAETIAGQKPHINYLLIPNVVYTWPEVAAVGYTEEELKSQGRQYRSGSFPFKASGRSRASMDTDGFIKVLADQNTDEILGVHMIGPRVADMIAEAVTAMEFRASAEDMARMSHAHPTYTEAFKEACLAASGLGALHL